MNSTLKIAFLIAAALKFSGAFAQEAPKLGDFMDVEARTAMKKMTDELTKPNPNTPPPPPPPPVLPPAPKAPPPATYAVYGLSPNYEAEITFEGDRYVVRVGSRVRNYLVSDVTLRGVELKRIQDSTSKKSKSKMREEIIFAPIGIR